MDVAKTVLAISVGIMIIAAWVFVANFIWQGWTSLNEEVRSYLPGAVLAGIGVFLFAIRNVEGANRHLLQSFGILIAVIVPLIAGLKFLMVTSLGQVLL